MTAQSTRTLLSLLIAMAMLAFACGDGPRTGSATALDDPRAPADDRPPSDTPVEPANNTPNEPDEPIDDPQDPPPEDPQEPEEDPQEPPDEPVEEPPVELSLGEPDWWVHIGNEERNALQAIAAGPQGHSAVLIQRIFANTPATIRSSITPDVVETSNQHLFRFDPEGRLQSAINLPVYVKSMAMDNAQNLIVVGEINGVVELGQERFEPSRRNVVIIKLGPDNAVRWVQTWDNNAYDDCHAVAVSDKDAVAVACEIDGRLTLAAYEPDGTVRFNRSYGPLYTSSSFSAVRSVVWHNDTRLGIAGFSQSSLDMDGDGENEIIDRGASTAFVGVYDAQDGRHIWSKGAGGELGTVAGHLDAAHSCAFDPAGNLIATLSIHGHAQFEGRTFGPPNERSRTDLIASWNPDNGALRWLHQAQGQLTSNANTGLRLLSGNTLQQLSPNTGLPIVTTHISPDILPPFSSAHLFEHNDLYTFTLIEADHGLAQELGLEVHQQPDAVLHRFSLIEVVP